MVVIVHTVKSVELIRQLTKKGWILDRVAGSHHIFKHPTKPGHISVPHPKADLGKGLMHKVLKQAGLR
jgi:predicted RNA binding protein YcfA (HicA-like mRNA interferase family)